MSKSMSIEQFVEKVKGNLGDKVDLSEAEYVNATTKVKVTCNVHNNTYWTKPPTLLRGSGGCQLCKDEAMRDKFQETSETIMQKFKEAHGDKYEYPNFKGGGSETKIDIICPEHGLFRQRIITHKRGGGCDKCAAIERGIAGRLSLDEVFSKFEEKHGDKYDYSKVVLNADIATAGQRVKIVCPKHGEFTQTVATHASGYGCKECGKEKAGKSRRHSQEEFINLCKKVHGDRYDYSKVIYNGIKNKIEIICKHHGVFWQMADGHLQGKGCAKCNSGYRGPSVGENKVKDLLESWGLQVIQSDRKIIRPKELDIVLPEKKIAIEYNGHHFHHHMKKDERYHLDKYYAARKKGYKMLSLWDFDCNHKWGMVQKYLSRIAVDYEPTKKDLKFKWIGETEAREFYKKFGLFTTSKTSALNLGIIGSEGEVMAMVSLSSNREKLAIEYFVDKNFNYNYLFPIVGYLKDKCLNGRSLLIRTENDSLIEDFVTNSFNTTCVEKDTLRLALYHHRFGLSHQMEWDDFHGQDKIKSLGVDPSEDLLTLHRKLRKDYHLKVIIGCGENYYRLE